MIVHLLILLHDGCITCLFLLFLLFDLPHLQHICKVNNTNKLQDFVGTPANLYKVPPKKNGLSVDAGNITGFSHNVIVYGR